MTQPKVEAVLSSHRVLDLTEDGCMLCAKILGDMGADVIKIEPPGGSPTRNIGPFYHDIPDPQKSLTWFFLGLNKRGITLNLETADGRELFKKLVKTVCEKFRQLDILINNAGITHSSKFEETRTEDWQRCMQVNATAPFILCREALPLLRKSSTSYIINISSVVGVKGYPLQCAYTASKHALRGATMSLAEELNDTNVRVHLICPGGVDTDLIPQVRPDLKTHDLIEKIGDTGHLIRALMMSAETRLWQGDYAGAVLRAEKGMEYGDSDQTHIYRYGNDSLTCCKLFGGMAKWFLGYPDSSLAIYEALHLL